MIETSKYFWDSMLSDLLLSDAERRVQEAQQALRKAEAKLRDAQANDEALRKTFVRVTKQDGTSYVRAPRGSLVHRGETERSLSNLRARLRRSF
jgi:coenzyme F420-reducing hydrogenase alpha subunit